MVFMGKFYEALRRSGTIKEEQPSTNSENKVVKISTGPPLQGPPPDPRMVEEVAEEAPFTPHHDVDPRMACLIDPNSTTSESFKMLRTKLLVMAREKPLRSILVTSAEPLDGKSLMAANLAVSIAQGVNDYVLLVDCDIRAPSIHRLFNLNPPAGITEYLQEGASVAPFLVKSPLEKLTVLPGGRPAKNPSELLCSAKMRALVEELKSRYDDRFIILDSPPGQFTAETAFLARLMDGILLVARYGKTPRHLIQDTIENIGRERILGVVFNASEERMKDYRYYYRHYRKPSR
jgi:capsular exopolysaccharide synthesis family protein